MFLLYPKVFPIHKEMYRCVLEDKCLGESTVDARQGHKWFVILELDVASV
jgi:hypothetical protein